MESGETGMLKRKILNDLISWKNAKKRECLLVKGARQVGKTFIVQKFGRENYGNYVYLNFIENPALKNIFEGSLQASEIYKKMSVYVPGLRLVPGDTLIFLDEIQECPEARTALKFLAIDDRYDVVASGSLLGINYKGMTSVPVGYERQMTMYPLDFEEFLWATGTSADAISYLRSFFDDKRKVDAGINEEMFSKLREYVIVGGMPDVVNTFVETGNYGEVQRAQDKILADCDNDMTRYAETGEKTKIRKCYRSVPRQLAKENRKFQYSVVEKGSTSRKFGESVQWLIDANLVIPVYNVSSPVLPLDAYTREDSFKIYLHDIGLLTAMYGFEIKAPLLDNTLTGPAKGGIYENLIADMLSKRGYDLRFYKAENGMQRLEFLITQNSRVIPVEVKAGNGASVSLNNFIDRHNPPYAYKLITGNLGVSDTKITLPLYMAMFI